MALIYRGCLSFFSLFFFFQNAQYTFFLLSYFPLTTWLYTAASTRKELVLFRWVLKLQGNCESSKKKGPLLWISVFWLLFPSTSLELKKQNALWVKKKEKVFKGWCEKLKNQDISDYPQQSGFPGWTHELPRWISRNQYANISEVISRVNSLFLNSLYHFCFCLVRRLVCGAIRETDKGWSLKHKCLLIPPLMGSRGEGTPLVSDRSPIVCKRMRKWPVFSLGFIPSVNSFLMGFWSQSLIPSDWKRTNRKLDTV